MSNRPDPACFLPSWNAVTSLLPDSMIPVAAIVISVAFGLPIARFGIVRHATGYSASDYLSRFTWLLAMGINVFGAGVLVLAIRDLL